jgi:hypothetical protein
MTLPYTDAVKPSLSEEERKAAVLKLLFTIMPIEGVAILVVFVIPVFVLGWDSLTMVFVLVGVLMVTSAYLMINLAKIGKR